MRPTICYSCHSLLRTRLRSQIAFLALQRSRFHSSSTVLASQKGAYITSQYIDTFPPTAQELESAAHFFAQHVPTKSWTASEWRKHISQHSNDLNDITPEIAFLGRSNSGKSSLLNALLENSELCRVGPKPGKTITMHAWTLAYSEPRYRTKRHSTSDAEPKLTVLDMPGYGHGSRAEWGQEIVKYMRRRRQLRRAFLLLNPKHGIKASDEQILQVLRAEGVPHQIVACKCDDLKASEFGPKIEELQDAVTQSATRSQAMGLLLSDVLAVGNLGDGKANQRVDSKSMKGLDNVRWAILQATGLEGYALRHLAEGQQQPREKRPLRIIDSVPASSSSINSLPNPKSI